MFRKAKALGEIGYSDQAIKLLEKVKEVNPDGERRSSCVPLFEELTDDRFGYG